MPPSPPIVRFETEPGHQMQADRATVGRGADKLKVFIATLGWSRASYVEFCDDERVETLIGCHERATALVSRAREPGPRYRWVRTSTAL
jgi:transposase